MQYLHTKLQKHMPEVEDELGRAIVDLGQLAAVLIAAGVDMENAEDVSFNTADDEDDVDDDDDGVDADDDDAEDDEPVADMFGEWGRQVTFGARERRHQTLRWSIVKTWPSQYYVVLVIDFVEPEVIDADEYADAQFTLRFDVRERTFSNWIEYDKERGLVLSNKLLLESLLRLLEPLGVNWHNEQSPRRPQLTSRSPDIARALRTAHLVASWFVGNEGNS